MGEIRRRLLFCGALVVLMLNIIAVSPAAAHQPHFEEEDITSDAPWQIDDPTVSLALYFTLETPADVDYATFAGRTGQRILVGITIPQIAGQKDFAPTMALMGPGLDGAKLPARVDRPADSGVLVIPSPEGSPETFYEPFSRTSYWERQEKYVTLPADGSYTIAVWHPEGQVGRYTLIVGDKERLGGDLMFPIKMKRYWTPVASSAQPTPQSAMAWWREIGSWLSGLVR